MQGHISIPSILHVNAEARNEGLKYYEVCCDKDITENSLIALEARTLYINFDVDWFEVKVPRRAFVHPAQRFCFESLVCSKIKNLQILSRWNLLGLMASMFKPMASLKHVRVADVIHRLTYPTESVFGHQIELEHKDRAEKQIRGYLSSEQKAAVRLSWDTQIKEESDDTDRTPWSCDLQRYSPMHGSASEPSTEARRDYQISFLVAKGGCNYYLPLSLPSEFVGMLRPHLETERGAGYVVVIDWYGEHDTRRRTA